MAGPVAIVFALCLSQTGGMTRDSYGVPHIRGLDTAQAYTLMGAAVSDDRLWQMEMSRRASTGRLAEVLGPSFAASDKAVLARAYTEAEYRQMIEGLPESSRELLTAYVVGVNTTINRRKQEGTLPPGYATNGFEPEPWTETDSAAILVSLARRFGQGGAGELRNYALVQYLRLRPVKDRLLDALDDLAWQNDPRAVTTVAPADDRSNGHPAIWDFTRKDSEAHLAKMPPTSLLELAPAVRVASQEEFIAAAATLSVPYKVGSYCMVVSPERSNSGDALLLTAPQMGHQAPSIVHEVVLTSPTMFVRGMNVPGVPAVLIGNTPDLAWGLTSGVADLEDVFVSPLGSGDTYLAGGKETTLQSVTFKLKVKGQPDQYVVQKRTIHGPVLLQSRGSKAVYSLKSAFWMREVGSLAPIHRLASVKSVADVDRFVADVPVSFNFFFALKGGQTGYRYAGSVPIRAKGIDPRLPTPDLPENAWRGFVPANQMPRIDNAKSGLVTNWNNKPVAWWPNGDTPVWGQVFRTTELNRALPAGKLSLYDLQRAAWTIARRETDDNASFVPVFAANLSKEGDGLEGTVARLLTSFDGWEVAESPAARVYGLAVRNLRRELFMGLYGNFTSDDLFVTVVQPSVMLKAVSGELKYDVLGGRTVKEAVNKAFQATVEQVRALPQPGPLGWGYVPGTMPGPNGERIPYNNRGTYIQVNSLGKTIHSWNVVTPGVAESGAHAFDQASLARDWVFKPMSW